MAAAAPVSWTALLNLLSAVSLIVSDTAYGDEKALYAAVFSGYNPAVRPRRQADHPVNVHVEFELNGINGIDEINQVVSTIGFIVAIWDDDYLSWDPADHQGIEHLVVPPTDVWLPDIGIINSAERFYKEEYFKYFRVDIRYDGRIIWKFGGLFNTQTTLDVTAYPFDTQECEIEIENWAYTKESVDLLLIRNTINLDNYVKNGEWEILATWVVAGEFEIDTHPGKPIPLVHFWLRIKRKWGYYGLNILTPTLFITFTALVVFWLPPESGEKVSLGITVLLAFSVFQLVIAEHTPRTSDYTPVLSVFLAFVMGMSTTSILSAIIVVYIFHKGAHHSLPRWLRVLAFRYLARAMCMQGIVSVDGDGGGATESNKVEPTLVNSLHIEDMETLSNGKINIQLDCTKPPPPPAPTDDILKHLELYTSHLQAQSQQSALAAEWQCLSRVIDRAFFWVTFVAIFVASVAIFANVNEASHLTDLSRYNLTDGQGIDALGTGH